MDLNDPVQREAAEKAIASAGPEFLKKYGNPLDKNDPRHWAPSTRGERGISLSDRVRLLELDMELQNMQTVKIIEWIAGQQEKELIEELRTNPQAAVEKLAAMLGEEVPEDIKNALSGYKGPGGNDGPLYAGSVKGAASDALVVTPQGTIRVDQIPGYRADPEWVPSADWVDMNCLCESHVAARENNAIDDRFIGLTNPDDDGRGGMYL